MPRKPNILDDPADLRRRAEGRLSGRPGDRKLNPGAQRLFHELEVHKIELEMQNAELQEARDKIETLLETYIDLYDFAPVGYYSVDEHSQILAVNLTGAALLGVERSRLITRRLLTFASASHVSVA